MIVSIQQLTSPTFAMLAAPLVGSVGNVVVVPSTILPAGPPGPAGANGANGAQGPAGPQGPAGTSGGGGTGITATSVYVTTAGTVMLASTVGLVQVNVAGSVTIVLPLTTSVSFGGLFANPIIIQDVGGHALATPITITAATGDTVLGATSIQIIDNYGAYTLVPNATTRTWTDV